MLVCTITPAMLMPYAAVYAVDGIQHVTPCAPLTPFRRVSRLLRSRGRPGHMLAIESIHHVSLPITDLERAKRFYRDVLGLEEIRRPAFRFAGAWYQVGDRQLHLIVGEESTFRAPPRADSHDIHFAIRVGSYRRAIEHLASKGYGPDATDVMLKTKENPTGTAGFPQVYLLDPDRNVIEINAAQLD
jgi:catechol 2,3-dioxygenase-like lactoylglutathione lyase family enzyme